MRHSRVWYLFLKKCNGTSDRRYLAQPLSPPRPPMSLHASPQDSFRYFPSPTLPYRRSPCFPPLPYWAASPARSAFYLTAACSMPWTGWPGLAAAPPLEWLQSLERLVGLP